MDGKRAGVKLHDFAHVRQKIRQAMFAGIGVILMFHTLSLKLLMQGGGAVFKSKVILVSAIEVDCLASQS